jgi:hypothetical protein|tara:strand:- start:552 stop:809 length:258 start_codon:yes stop_codon:yes gene_type:complete
LIQNKKAPMMQDPEISRALQEVYDDINSIINEINNAEVRVNKLIDSGREGSLRVALQPDNKYKIEAKTNEGWVVSANNLIDKERG